MRRDRLHSIPRPARRAIAAALVSGVLALPVLAPAQARSAPESFADLAEALLPTVVNVATTQLIETRRSEELEEFFKEFFERRGQLPPRGRRRANSLGSGFIIDPAGYIVTNNHVIAEADEITVRLHDDTTLEAKVVGRDEKTDLALLKVDTDKPLPAAKWGDSEKTRIGDWVIAIGNPFGLGGTVTAGIVSARQRDINAGPYDDFIQTDAAINRGNSGGPMFNVDGEVIGVNTAIFSPSGGSIGIGFAIPSALARNVIAQLRKYGEVRRGWLGVRIQTVTEELAEGLRLGKPHGALVASVTEGGPAEAAGIQQGDVILEFDGREVTDMRKLPRMVAETAIGREVDVVVWRKGKKKTLKVTLGELEEEKVAAATAQTGEPEAASGAVPALGLELDTMTPELRERFGIDDKAEGVVITDVDESSSAAEKGLRPGDVIVEVDQEQVKTPGDVVERINKAKDEGYRVVTLLVFRDGDFQWIAVRLDDS
ncbi:MAG: DegQ family serine endoprotease [Alphaproteobacteria bacterium]|nr:MAG: DegQ family serine endoprotease [Alphaproteobacteria bacterium]